MQNIIVRIYEEIKQEELEIMRDDVAPIKEFLQKELNSINLIGK